MKLIKKLIVSAFIFVLAFSFTNIPVLSSPTVAQAATIKLNATKKTLEVGKTYTLKVTGTKKTVKWSTSNKKVATVSSKGKVKAVAKGTAKITASVAGKKLVCTVTVKNPANPYLKDAPFKAKELSIANFSLVVPDGWSLKTDSLSAEGVIATLSSNDTSITSSVTIVIGIDTDTVEYSDMKEAAVATYTLDNLKLLAKTSIGSDDFEIKDYSQNEITLGTITSMKTQYTIIYSGITLKQTVYDFAVKNYGIEIAANDMGDTSGLDLAEVAEYAIKSLVIK